MKTKKWLILGLCGILLASFPSCSTKSDRSKLIGIWKILEINFLSREIGDGLDWFQFYEDGIVQSRMGSGSFQKGWWSISPEKHTLYIRENVADSMAYDYNFIGDTLEMRALVGNVNHVTLRMARTEKVLVEYEAEMSIPKPADWR